MLHIHDLPTEVLYEIFLFCVPGPIVFDCMTCRGPWTLTFVCRRWREAAIGLPDLWSRLRLKAVERRRHDFVMLCIERTGNAPIHFNVYNVRNAVLDVIRASAHRLATLEISGGPREVFRLGVLPPTPILQRLSIRYSTYDTNPLSGANILQIVTDCPGVRSLTVSLSDRMLSRVPRMRALPVQWHLLHDMDIDLHSDSDGILRVLEPCQGLQMLRLEGSNSIEDDDVISMNPITMPSLTWLALTDFEEPSTLFGYMRCPALRTLVIHGAGADNVLALLNTSKCALQTLEFLSAESLDMDSGWDDVLLCLPTLETLVLTLLTEFSSEESMQFGGAAITQHQELAQQSDEVVARKLPPQIKRLVIEYEVEDHSGEKDSEEMWKTMLELVESYWVPDGPLEEVCILGRSWSVRKTLLCPSHYRKRFEAMQSKGLHIHAAPGSGGASIIAQHKCIFFSGVISVMGCGWKCSDSVTKAYFSAQLK
ncbi:hypothetical protein CYLTODRAFT_491181, partial [Cylindrobasidium torrendii FP15055 ss-10]